jgi:spermidine synthase
LISYKDKESGEFLMVKVGEHITLDIIGTKKDYSPSFFEKIVYKIAKKSKVTVLEISRHKFEPQGFTLVALLAESHMSFHTFPEKNIISFDFFTCGKVSPAVALDIIRKEIEHKRIVKKEFNRDTVGLYDDIYNSPGLKKFYIVNNVLEDFTSKVGQHIEILDLEEFGKSLFIDNELQVAANDEHLYSSTFVNSSLKLSKGKDKVAIIGGGDGGVARECISQNFNFIDWFELDPEVVEVCNKHLSKVGNKATEKNSVKCIWGDAFESIKSIDDNRYDKIFVDLNDDQYCIDLAAKNMNLLKRILKPKGVITAQVGSQDKKPKQVDNWLKVFHKSFGNTTLDRVYIPSFDCSWNFSSSINH